MIRKRGQNSTIGVIIAIILAIGLIVFLIWGFSSDWKMFSSTSKSYLGGSNLGSAESACRVACQNGLKSQYCEAKKSLVIDGNKVERSCFELVDYGNLDIDCPIDCGLPSVNNGMPDSVPDEPITVVT